MGEDEEKNTQVMEFPIDAEENVDTAPEVQNDITPENLFKRFMSNRLYIAVAAAGIIIIISALYATGVFTGMMVNDNSETLSSQEIGQNTLSFVNNYLLEEVSATLVSVEEESGLYKVNTMISGQEVPIYSTMDGKYIILPQGFIDVEEYEAAIEAALNQPEPAEGGEIPKTEKPVVNLFVMSYCPYGLQMQKAMIPVMEILGEKVDFNINFVHYLMHGEKEMVENNNQYCIQKEESLETFTKYLRCFVQSDDSEGCREEAGVDETKFEACLVEVEEIFGPKAAFDASSSSYPPYPVDAQLANLYGVGGSPTTVINGQTVSLQRSPEAVKAAICDAFITPPVECETTLSTNAAAPSIGPMESSSASSTDATCG